ncbi:hypothetical protein DFJ75_3466 [Williamsia muralis]|uniref:Uncharacterized protein n=1 Tax=Williamsia marianensis TaxID=85044 RepID=A0A495K5P0_WILMA|nr:phospholipase D family protein [Williamsia muralis]RKR96613.1 hypothetical protein DFJ75_3466 [Williamsia muralis]
MLDPETRHLLTDALRPPDGHRVDVAVATTYTLNLDSLLLAPLAMAAYAHTSENVESVSALALLESVRRYAAKTTVFVQAGGIHVPSQYRRLSAFAEDCVVEVIPPTDHVFHPKVWAVRFVTPEGGYSHRFVCLSRNLTMDRSWDTVLILDENPDATNLVDAASLGEFIRELLTMANPARALKSDRANRIVSLADTISLAKFEAPNPFTRGEIHVFGSSSGSSWPLPARADSLVVISPFLDASTVARLPVTGSSMLVSRDVAFDRIGAGSLTGVESTHVLQPGSDSPDDPDGADGMGESGTPGRPGEVPKGLHAKVFAWDTGKTGHVLTGSANCTGAAFGGNVELSVLLEGPKSLVGAGVLLDAKSGLKRVLQPYSPKNQEPLDDSAFALEREIEKHHGELALCGLILRVGAADAKYLLSLSLRHPVAPLGDTTIRPIAVSKFRALPLDGLRPSWTDLGLIALSPYVVVETCLSRDGVDVTRSCVLQAELLGAPDDLNDQLFREILARGEDILRYLALLLGDPSLDSLIAAFMEGQTEGSANSIGARGFDDLILLEPLVRAAARSDGALDRVNDELEALKDNKGQLPQLSSEFFDLWRVVWEARKVPDGG